MMLPSLRDWVFSAKTFVSAMLALYIALLINLDRPYWALLTVYIVAQPLAGAMRSKGAYRIVGTVMGASAAVALVPNLVNAPELLSAALALWTGMCVYFSVLDRTPRSYIFLLAGYTAAIIAFPVVDTPLAIWDTAIARVEETVLAIICTTLIGTIVFPRPLGPVLMARIDAWFADARTWGVTVLSGRMMDDVAIRAARRAIASAAVEIRQLTTHLAFDTSILQAATRPVGLLEGRIMLLLPVLGGVDDRLASLRAAGAVPAHVQALMQRLADWIDAGGDAPEDEEARLRADIEAAEPEIGPASRSSAIILRSLLARIAELADIVHDVRALRRQIATGGAVLPQLAVPPGIAPDATRFRDHGMALLSGFAAALAVSLVCVFWIATEWPHGGSAALIAAVGCSFFAAQDDPAPAIVQFLRYISIALAIDAVYLFAVLPRATSFEMLALAVAPTLLILGVLIANPATFFTGLAIAVNLCGQLGLSDAYKADFASFCNTALALTVGMTTAATVTRIVRSVGAATGARRLRRANRQEIARVASRQSALDRPALTAVLLDRLSELVPRLAMSDAHADTAVHAALLDLRVGLNVVMLQQCIPSLPTEASAAVTALLDDLAEHFRRRAPDAPPAPALLPRIDRAIAAVAAAPCTKTSELLMSLVGMRHIMFPSAPPYEPQPVPAAPTLEEVA
jgi:uncharacterized membrane protein YccC